MEQQRLGCAVEDAVDEFAHHGADDGFLGLAGGVDERFVAGLLLRNPLVSRMFIMVMTVV